MHPAQFRNLARKTSRCLYKKIPRNLIARSQSRVGNNVLALRDFSRFHGVAIPRRIFIGLQHYIIMLILFDIVYGAHI